MGLTRSSARVHEALPSPGPAFDLEPHLRRWATRMRAAGMAETTVTERPRQIRHLANAGLDVFNLDEDDILGYLASPDLSKNSRSTYFYGLRAWHAYLYDRGIRPDNPMHGITSPKVPEQQIRPILNMHVRALLESRIRTNTRGMILLGAYAGLRAHEIAKFRSEDIDDRAGVMEVVGKGAKARYIAVHPLVGEHMRLYAPQRGYWFPSRNIDGQPVLTKSVVIGLSRAMDRAGVPGTCHSLRRWFATTMLENGVDIRVVQVLLGHASLATTQKYLYVQPARAHAAVLRLPVVA